MNCSRAIKFEGERVGRSFFSFRHAALSLCLGSNGKRHHDRCTISLVAFIYFPVPECNAAIVYGSVVWLLPMEAGDISRICQLWGKTWVRRMEYVSIVSYNECNPKEKYKFPGAPLVNNSEILIQYTNHYVCNNTWYHKLTFICYTTTICSQLRICTRRAVCAHST